jgi:hypothetical protein
LKQGITQYDSVAKAWEEDPEAQSTKNDPPSKQVFYQVRRLERNQGNLETTPVEQKRAKAAKKGWKNRAKKTVKKSVNISSSLGLADIEKTLDGLVTKAEKIQNRKLVDLLLHVRRTASAEIIKNG